MITTLSSREFNQDSSGAKNAANKGPVIITDRGKPAHVLLSFAAYKKLTGDNLKFVGTWQSRSSLNELSIRYQCSQ
jgi:prevent-host-death family protein